MAGSPKTPIDVVRAGVNAALGDVYIARPGKVTAYDPATNTAFVKPMVKRALYTQDDERVYEELPEIPFVPVLWQRAGHYVVTCPMTPGDSVLLVFCDVGIAEWRESGELSEPIDARTHSVGWPVAIPGFFPDNDQLSTDALDLAARVAGMLLGQHDGDQRIEISATGIKIGKQAIDFVALSIPTDAALAACMAAANATLTLAAGVLASLTGHTHTSAAAGSPTGPPVYVTALPSPPTPGTLPGSVAALGTKAF